jgi:hypothetical protein
MDNMVGRKMKSHTGHVWRIPSPHQFTYRVDRPSLTRLFKVVYVLGAELCG